MTREPRNQTCHSHDASDTEVAISPRPVLRPVRNAAPGPGSAVVVKTRCEAEEVLRQPEIYSSAGRLLPGGLRPVPPIELDPPAHAAWRAVLDPLFAPSRAGQLASTISRLARELIDEFANEQEIDFAARFSIPLPAQTLMTLFGLPLEDLPWFLDLKDGVIRPNRVLGKPSDDPEVIAYQATMTAEAYGYFGEALDSREADSRGDLLSAFLDLEIDGAPVDRDSLLDLCFGLLVEGIEPMSAALDCAFLCLAENPEYRKEVVATPRRAIEELLRWATPVTFVTRTAAADTVLGGCPVSAGQRVRVLLSEANVDPVAGLDASVLRWNRTVNTHLAFGTGIHRCLGSHLARIQLAIALREWHSRIPHYSVARPDELAFTPGVRTVDRFPMWLGKQL
ncbi:cytochrome P450 [Mycobacterium sp. BK086]|nr:cytochrome P450 [Mycobacterium sp. BK086]